MWSFKNPQRKKIWGVQIGWIQRPHGFAAPADQQIRESVVQPFHRDVGCMWSCLILLEPLHISIHATTCPKTRPELVEHHNVMLLCDGDYLLVCVFKPKRFNYAMFWDGHPGHAFYRVLGPLKHLLWGLCAPEHIVLATDAHRARSVLRRWTKHQESQDPLRSCSRTTGTSQHVLPCQMLWVYAWSGSCMGTAEDSWSWFFALTHVKDPVLGYVIGWTFSGSFQQNLSPHSHCQEILQSASCQNWVFLPSCLDCLLILWLEICVANAKFVFSGDSCWSWTCDILLAPFWMISSPNK